MCVTGGIPTVIRARHYVLLPRTQVGSYASGNLGSVDGSGDEDKFPYDSTSAEHLVRSCCI
jgi:hypothetical protein